MTCNHQWRPRRPGTDRAEPDDLAYMDAVCTKCGVEYRKAAMRYTEHEQRQLDIASGEELDRIQDRRERRIDSYCALIGAMTSTLRYLDELLADETAPRLQSVRDDVRKRLAEVYEVFPQLAK